MVFLVRRLLLVVGPNGAIALKDDPAAVMSITDKTRKVLWGRSGNLCAFCKSRLVLDASAQDAESVVGEECHIISGALGGPRHDPSFPPAAVDGLENLILLCRVHHKLVDDQPETFTAAMLRGLRTNHEAWVQERLTATSEPKPVRLVRNRQDIPQHLVRVLMAKSLVDAAAGTFGVYPAYPADLDDAQLSAVRDLFQNLTDWTDLGLDDVSTRIDAQRSLSDDLNALDQLGLRVYVAQERQRLEGGVVPPSSVHLLHVRIVRADDPSQIQLPDAGSDAAV